MSSALSGCETVRLKRAAIGFQCITRGQASDVPGATAGNPYALLSLRISPADSFELD